LPLFFAFCQFPYQQISSGVEQVFLLACLLSFVRRCHRRRHHRQMTLTQHEQEERMKEDEEEFSSFPFLLRISQWPSFSCIIKYHKNLCCNKRVLRMMGKFSLLSFCPHISLYDDFFLCAFASLSLSLSRLLFR